METRIVEIAERIKGLREMMDITPEAVSYTHLTLPTIA